MCEAGTIPDSLRLSCELCTDGIVLPDPVTTFATCTPCSEGRYDSIPPHNAVYPRIYPRIPSMP